MFAMTANVAGLVQSRANPAARAGIDALGATALVALVAVVVFAALADARIVSALAARVTADIGSVRSRVCGCVAAHRDDDARRGERSNRLVDRTRAVDRAWLRVVFVLFTHARRRSIDRGRGRGCRLGWSVRSLVTIGHLFCARAIPTIVVEIRVARAWTTTSKGDGRT